MGVGNPRHVGGVCLCEALASSPSGSQWSFANVRKEIEIPFVWLTTKKNFEQLNQDHIGGSTRPNNVFPYFANSTETWSCLNPSRFRPAKAWWASFPWTTRVSVMFPSRKRTIMFPPHFCYHISVLSCFRYVSGFLTHVQNRRINVSETFPLRTIKVNKGKFTLEIGPLNGSHALNTRARCIDAATVKCARLPLFSILSDYCAFHKHANS